MTKDELSLLLFLETAFVDHGGLLCSKHMNSDDMAIAKRWTDDLYVKFERICSEDLKPEEFAKNHCVWLCPEAMADAHAERKARAVRRYNSRTRRTVYEFHEEAEVI